MRPAPIALCLLALVGCRGARATSPTEPTVLTLPGPIGARPLAVPETSPEELPGVDTKALSDRERVTWWRLVSQLYAPCPDQAVSVAQCVKESRSCNACAPAASLLAAKVKEGATLQEGEALYATRFGPNVKTVEAGDSPARGPADAAVTLVVWSDFECPHCRFAMPLLDKILERHAPRVRLVHKFYPLHGHSRAEPAARAAIAALNQGHYWEMERLLFDHQHDLTDTDLDRYATDLGLDLRRFHADLIADRTSKILERDRADADRDGLSGTPFILINGREFDLAYFHPEADLEPWVALELKLKGAAPASPPPLAPLAVPPPLPPSVNVPAPEKPR